jgi:hypothetical protein
MAVELLSRERTWESRTKETDNAMGKPLRSDGLALGYIGVNSFLAENMGGPWPS